MLSYNNFYDVFIKIKDNNNNYIDFIVWQNYDFVIKKKTFSEIYEDIRLCYTNLNNLGICQDNVVGLDIENTYDFLVCDAALLLIGAQTVISNNKEKIELLNQRLKDFNADFVITNREIDNDKQSVINIRDLFIKKSENIEILQKSFNEKDISIMFSSGTTGIPKALGITEYGSIWSSNNFFNYMNFSSDDKFLIFMPLSNYQQRFLFWGCLMNNVNISLANDMSLFHSLVRLTPTILLAPPNFYYNLYCEQLKESNKNIDYLRKTLGDKMNYLLTGMAPIDNSVLEFYRDCNMEIYQIYGQTEIGMIACNIKSDNKLGSVGKPIIDLFLSEDKEVVTQSPHPIVSRYYLDDSSEFLSNVRPTGDIGQFDEEGFLYIRGRMNDTIILNNGKKINPTMVENEIKDRYKSKEVVLYKTRLENDVMLLNVVIFIDEHIQIEKSDLESFIMNLPQIKAASEEVKISIYNMTPDLKKQFYTENGKFSRARAIKFLTD